MHGYSNTTFVAKSQFHDVSCQKGHVENMEKVVLNVRKQQNVHVSHTSGSGPFFQYAPCIPGRILALLRIPGVRKVAKGLDFHSITLVNF